MHIVYKKDTKTTTRMTNLIEINAEMDLALGTRNQPMPYPYKEGDKLYTHSQIIMGHIISLSAKCTTRWFYPTCL